MQQPATNGDGETKNVRPLTAEETAAHAQLRGTAWSPVYDAESDSFYYWNMDTDETSWDLPSEKQLKERKNPLPIVEHVNRAADHVGAGEEEEGDQAGLRNVYENHNEQGVSAESLKEQSPAKRQRTTEDQESTAEAATLSSYYNYPDQASSLAAAVDYSQYYQQNAEASFSAQQYASSSSVHNPDNTISGDYQPYGGGASSSTAADYQDYSITAQFNARSGRFESNPLRNPAMHTVHARANRQMSAYFDYGSWAEERGKRLIDLETGLAEEEKRKKPTKKDLERWKTKKVEKQKKKRQWLFED